MIKLIHDVMVLQVLDLVDEVVGYVALAQLPGDWLVHVQICWFEPVDRDHVLLAPKSTLKVWSHFQAPCMDPHTAFAV